MATQEHATSETQFTSHSLKESLSLLDLWFGRFQVIPRPVKGKEGKSNVHQIVYDHVCTLSIYIPSAQALLQESIFALEEAERMFKIVHISHPVTIAHSAVAIHTTTCVH